MRIRMQRRIRIFNEMPPACTEVLTRHFLVQFLGEEGVGAGALKAEYFGELLKEMDRRLFEGSSSCRVPKKSFQGGPSHDFA